MEPITVLCPQCGEMVEVKDPQALIMALHLANDCELASLFGHASRGE